MIMPSEEVAGQDSIVIAASKAQTEIERLKCALLMVKAKLLMAERMSKLLFGAEALLPLIQDAQRTIGDVLNQKPL